jgi:hypothetical protein
MQGPLPLRWKIASNRDISGYWVKIPFHAFDGGRES